MRYEIWETKQTIKQNPGRDFPICFFFMAPLPPSLFAYLDYLSCICSFALYSPVVDQKISRGNNL